ncbi:MAG TPA: LppX_LprAFG lipoprotein [Solirubrobacterales bacterium]
MDGTTSYVSSDAFDSIPDGKKWLELDLASAATGPRSSAAGNPKEGLKVLEKVQGAEKIGQEDIDGVPTTHYRGTFPAAEEVFGVKVDVSDRHVDVWIDAQGRVRRMQAALKTAVTEVEGSASTTEMTIDYVSFGRVPKIELPNPDEVFNATGEFESKLQSAARSH